MGSRLRGPALAAHWPSVLTAACIAIVAATPLQAASAVPGDLLGATPTTGTQVADIDITKAVENTLAFQDAISPVDIDVSTDHGVVTLGGSVDNILVKERVVTVAESIRGVRAVISLVTVQTPPRSDADIRRDVEAALLTDPAAGSYQVTVDVKNAAVTLRGKVGSYAERQLADRVAKGVIGVREEHSDVAIDYGAKRSDPEVAADIRERLQWDLWLNGDIIDVTVTNGTVALTGVVGSASARTRAMDDAWVLGVVAVDSGALDVRPWVRSESRRKLTFATRSDEQIRQAVLATFRQDPRLKAVSPQVSVTDGAVFLSGTVGDLKAKDCADQDAKNVVGVGVVINRLLVRPAGLVEDGDIAKQLKLAFAWDPILQFSAITTTVANHVVRLAGTADSFDQRDEAQEVAMRTKGVVLVRNRIRVEPGIPAYDDGSPYANHVPFFWFGAKPHASDEQLKTSIEREISWSPLIERDDLHVAVSGGVATLTGSIGSWIGRDEAVVDARRGGAVDVVDDIEVKQGGWWRP